MRDFFTRGRARSRVSADSCVGRGELDCVDGGVHELVQRVDFAGEARAAPIPVRSSRPRVLVLHDPLNVLHQRSHLALEDGFERRAFLGMIVALLAEGGDGWGGRLLRERHPQALVLLFVAADECVLFLEPRRDLGPEELVLFLECADAGFEVGSRNGGGREAAASAAAVRRLRNRLRGCGLEEERQCLVEPTPVLVPCSRTPTQLRRVLADERVHMPVRAASAIAAHLLKPPTAAVGLAAHSRNAAVEASAASASASVLLACTAATPVVRAPRPERRHELLRLDRAVRRLLHRRLAEPDELRRLFVERILELTVLIVVRLELLL
mmetsp:Transcript_18796/g.61396  ORF Transcript_18796/g.61396 Transcript_18796/m.61396 type:complete len:325 (-) Transcript_18796:655-1629(-)